MGETIGRVGGRIVGLGVGQTFPCIGGNKVEEWRWARGSQAGHFELVVLFASSVWDRE